jgi:hypothetical protein
MNPQVTWPEGRRFAFTVFDDTDAGTVENLREVYALLRDCGLRTTKSVWPLAGSKPPEVVGGATCAEAAYLAWVKSLQRDGFEIGFHNATYHSSTRAQTIRGLDAFREMFGHDPRTMATHTTCREGLYWGADRVSGWHRLVYNLLTGWRQQRLFRGHVEGDPHFWGDVCRPRIKYVRNFVFSEINTLKVCPFMPYHDPQRPFVNAWFASSEGGRVEPFNQTISEANQDRLEAEGGACIMYTHFAKGFYAQGRLDPRFKELVQRLAGKGGWFVPVATLLDYLGKQNGGHVLSGGERSQLERRWLAHKVRVGTT